VGFSSHWQRRRIKFSLVSHFFSPFPKLIRSQFLPLHFTPLPLILTFSLLVYPIFCSMAGCSMRGQGSYSVTIYYHCWRFFPFLLIFISIGVVIFLLLVQFNFVELGPHLSLFTYRSLHFLFLNFLFLLSQTKVGSTRGPAVTYLSHLLHSIYSISLMLNTVALAFFNQLNSILDISSPRNEVDVY